MFRSVSELDRLAESKLGNTRIIYYSKIFYFALLKRSSIRTREIPISLVMGGKLLIVGDFNIHEEVVGNATARKFLSLLDSHGLTQTVLSPTHLDGHTLDLVISRPSDKVVSGCVVSALIEDHFAVHMLVRVHRPVRPQKKITYCELDRIDADLFLSDLLTLPLLTVPSDDLDELLLQYNSCLSSLLDKHAPVRSKVITVRPPNPWVSAEVLDIQRKCRSVERWWRHRKKKGIALEVDREIVRNVLKVKRLCLRRKRRRSSMRRFFFLL